MLCARLSEYVDIVPTLLNFLRLGVVILAHVVLIKEKWLW
jgi:hypothetical protein